MRRTRDTISLAVLLLAVVLSGCGGDSEPAAKLPLPPITKVVGVSFASAAIRGAKLPAVYTCDGKDISPPLSWGALPSDIEELALFAVDVTPGATGPASRSVVWALAGVNPALRHLAAGEIPQGAFLEQSSDGKRRYSICPRRGQAARYEFALYALPPRVRADPSISGAALLDNLTGKDLQGRSPATGVFSVAYARR
jgi:phosphatidylethanolamine-binding protein (PEBP) family uncharacterized protein